jgi:hypothetical protein
LIITICASDLSAMESAYTNVLGYSVVERGSISKDLAGVWAAPSMRGHSFIMMKPESDVNVLFRVVQLDDTPGYKPLSTFGWNASGILVQDPDALAAKIRASPTGFEVAGEPGSLGEGSPIRAMQAVGPAHEVLYLMRIPEGMPSTPFIVILGSPDLPMTQRFLSERLRLEVGKAGEARMTLLNKSFGLDIETKHPLAMAHISPEYSIELDGYPMRAKRRPQRKGELPPAMSVVTFETDDFDSVRGLLVAPPKRIKGSPYNGRRVGTIRGTALELIEVVESAAPTVH